MSLHYRKRGEVWRCRGSVRFGRQNVPVREFSTGCTVRSPNAIGFSNAAIMAAALLLTRPRLLAGAFLLQPASVTVQR